MPKASISNQPIVKCCKLRFNINPIGKPRYDYGLIGGKLFDQLPNKSLSALAGLPCANNTYDTCRIWKRLPRTKQHKRRICTLV